MAQESYPDFDRNWFVSELIPPSNMIKVNHFDPKFGSQNRRCKLSGQFYLIQSEGP